MKKILLAALASAAAFMAFAADETTYLSRDGWTVSGCSVKTGDGDGYQAIIDNDPKTFWHNNYGTADTHAGGIHYLTIDMKEQKTLEGVTLYHRLGSDGSFNGNGCWQAFTVYVSNEAFNIENEAQAEAYDSNPENIPAGALNNIPRNNNAQHCIFPTPATGRYLLVIISSYDSNATCGALWPIETAATSLYTAAATAAKTAGDTFANFAFVSEDKKQAWQTATSNITVTDENSKKSLPTLISAYKALVDETHVTFNNCGIGNGSYYMGLYLGNTGAPRVWDGGEDARIWTLKANVYGTGFRLLNEYAQKNLVHSTSKGNGANNNATLSSCLTISTEYAVEPGMEDSGDKGNRYGIAALGKTGQDKYINTNTEKNVYKWSMSDQANDGSKWWIAVTTDELAATQDLKGAIAGYGTTGGRPIGNGLGQYTASSPENELAEANNKLTSGTIQDKRAAASAMRTAMANRTYTLNMPQPGKFYRIKCVNGNKYLTSDGYTHDVTTTTGEGDDAVTTTTTVTDNTKLGTIAYSNDGDRLSNTIWYLDAANKLVAITDGAAIKYGDSSTNWVLVPEAEAQAVIFSESAQALGKYNLRINGRWLHGSKGYVDSGAGDQSNSTDNGYQWNIEEAVWVPFKCDATLAKNDFHPFYSPVPLYNTTNDNGNGATRVKAYKVVISGEYAVKSAIEGNKIPANTPVLLQCQEAANNGHIWLQVAPGESAQDDETNHLSGSIYATEKADTHSYFTVANGDTPKFVAHSDDETIPGFTAHLAVETANAKAAGYTLVDEVPTSIEAVEAAANDSDTWYDLQGRRVNAPARGIFINANGRKVIK